MFEYRVYQTDFDKYSIEVTKNGNPFQNIEGLDTAQCVAVENCLIQFAKFVEDVSGDID